jgi:peroxiredoxin
VAVSLLVPAGLLAAVLVARDGGGSAPPSAQLLGAPDGSMPGPGDVAPLFDQPGLDGGRVRLADYRGRPVILTFFASWCLDCEREFPLLNEALVAHADAGLAVVGVTFRDFVDADARAFRARFDATWPAATDDRSEVARAYGVRNIPVTFFIGPNGRVVARVFGITTQAALDPPLQELLASARSAVTPPSETSAPLPTAP